jgi:putative endonuclease
MQRSFSDQKYYVYTLLSLKDFSIYTGLTNNLSQRLREHMRGIVSATNIRIPFKLVHYEYFVNLEDARAREQFLKSSTGRAQLKESLRKTLASKTYMPYKLIH